MRFSLFFMPLPGRMVILAGGRGRHFSFQISDYAKYPYSVFKIKWHLGSKTDRLAEGQFHNYFLPPHTPLSLLQWYSICVSYDSVTNDLIAVMDGRVIARFNNRDYNETPSVTYKYQ